VVEEGTAATGKRGSGGERQRGGRRGRGGRGRGGEGNGNFTLLEFRERTCLLDGNLMKTRRAS